MAANPGDDFLDQFLGYQTYDAATEASLGAGMVGPSGEPTMVQLNSGEIGGEHDSGVFPLGLSLAGRGFVNLDEPLRFRDDVAADRRLSSSPMNYVFSGQPMPNTIAAVPQPPAIRPRVRARRGHATDPHSIAERLRRGRIAERNKALQDLVPSVNKTDRAAMLEEIVDYVKFLQLQVEVLKISRLSGADAVAPILSDICISPTADETGEGGLGQPAWEKWSKDGTERQVAKLMEENVGAAMQYLQSKALCIVPISLASAIYNTHPPPDSTSFVKPETHPSS